MKAKSLHLMWDTQDVEAEWRRDAGGKEGLSKEAFDTMLFELVDLLVISDHPRVCSGFLEDLWYCICPNNQWASDNWWQGQEWPTEQEEPIQELNDPEVQVLYRHKPPTSKSTLFLGNSRS